METKIYEIKNKTERFIFFKWLKLVAFFLGSWWGLHILLFIILYVPTSKTGFLGLNAEENRQWLENNSEWVYNLILYIAIGIVIYYVYVMIKSKQVEKFIFNDNERLLTIFYKSYFLHIPSKEEYKYEYLNSTIDFKNNYLYGEHIVLRIYLDSKRIVNIDGSSSDWQRLPNFLKRINERIENFKTPYNMM